jgi:transcriptional regulator with PAS, ATPase and Fis domain
MLGAILLTITLHLGLTGRKLREAGRELWSSHGAHQMRAGKFELASGGTLFLDESGDLSPGGQAKLLRALEERTVVRVGGSVPIPVDVRVIAATNQPLEQMVRDKTFREDLFFRLNVVTLELPPLRERLDDIAMLAPNLLEVISRTMSRTFELSSDAIPLCQDSCRLT